MKDSVKLGAAVAGGYLLGRTKKGKAAIGLALWLSGKRIGNSREVLARLATSPELARLTTQVRGPLLEAAQRALTATIESRTTALADSLQERTSRLIDGTVTAVRDAEPEEPPAPRTRSGKAPKGRRDEPKARRDEPKASRDDQPAKATGRQEQEWVDLLDSAGDDDDGEPAEESAQPELPRQAKTRAGTARRSPAGRTTAGGREPARRRREPRDGA